jgi:hypothetical protein
MPPRLAPPYEERRCLVASSFSPTLLSLSPTLLPTLLP